MKTKEYIVLLVGAVLLIACKDEAPKERTAADMLAEIRADFETGKDSVVIDSIRSLRSKFPNAIAERKECLKLFQEASLRIAEKDLLHTDSLLEKARGEHSRLQGVINTNYPDGNAPTGVLEKVSKARLKADSLTVRYNTIGQEIRLIHARKGEK